MSDELSNTVETEITGIKTSLSTLEKNVNTKVAGDIADVTAKLSALETKVADDVGQQLDAASDELETQKQLSETNHNAQEAKITGNTADITALQARFNFPQIFALGGISNALQLIKGGDQLLEFSGANFKKGTKVKFLFDGKSVDAKTVSVDEVSGSWIKITTPEFKVKDDICAGGKGLDTPVKIRIYATGKSADEYITYPTTISNSASDFGDGRDGDFNVDRPRLWNEGMLGGAYHVKTSNLLSDSANKFDSGAGTVLVKKIYTYRQMPGDHFKCGQVSVAVA